jgi:hypothetical protein
MSKTEILDNLVMFKLSKLKELTQWLKDNLNKEDYDMLPDYEGVPVFVLFKRSQDVHLVRLQHPEWFYSDMIKNHKAAKQGIISRILGR